MQQVDAAALEAFATAVVETLGSPTDVARVVADSLVTADLRGHGSHGTRRLATHYPGMIDAGDLDPAAAPTVSRPTETAAVVDGQNGWGHVAGRRAVETGVELAREHAAAVVGVRDATHMGRIGWFAEQAAEAGILSVALVTLGGTSRLVAAPGSTGRNLSVNPIAMGAPSFGAVPHPIVLDVATGQVAHGRIVEKRLAGEPMPEDWAVDGEGDPLTDPAAFDDKDGAILPLGGLSFGHKGAALSLLVELFVGVVADAAVHGQGVSRGVNNAATFLFVDPERFGSRAAHCDRVAALAAHLDAIDTDERIPTGETIMGERIRLPGAPEYEAATERRENGIPFDDGAVRRLTDLATELDVEPLPPGFH
jgi:uncharacterized oxidoreductase